ncbi:MAG: ferrous iron transport protein A [Candidatus Odinarchaeota archaeon]
MKKFLSELGTGMKARIIEIERSEIRKDLLELGFLPGTVIERLRTAPLADPIEFKLRGFNISLRKVDADRIVIEEVSQPSC